MLIIEGVHDPIPIPVGFRNIAFAARPRIQGIGVTNHVQPVTSPALAIARRGQQPIHYLGERFEKEWSAKYSATSFGVGSRRVKSKVAQRISARLSAGWRGGLKFFASSRCDG